MSSPQTIIVDDTSSSIVYTGSWSAIRNSGAHDDSLHQTTTAGSTNTLSYIGSSTATIFGAIPPCDGDLAAPEYEITMDGITGSLMTVVCNSQFQNGLSVTAQGGGPSGVNAPHVLTVKNLGGSQNLPLMLDYIQYVSYIGQSSSSVVQSSTGAASSTASSSTTASSSSLSASSSSSTTTSAVSGSKAGPSPSSSTGFQTLAASTIIQLTTINGAATSVAVVITPTTIVGPNSSSSSFAGVVGGNTSHLIGPIVGGIIGAVLVTLLLVWLYGRRRRMSRSTSALAKRSPESVTPFNLSQNPSPADAGSSANRHSTSHVYHLPSIAQPSSGSAQSEQSMEDPTLLYDEKRASGPPFQAWTSFQVLESAPEPESSSSSSPSSAQQSFPHGRSSSIALSYATVPAYVRNPSTSRAHYRSGVSAFSISDVPPSYDTVRNSNSVPPVPPLDPHYSLQETV